MNSIIRSYQSEVLKIDSDGNGNSARFVQATKDLMVTAGIPEAHISTPKVPSTKNTKIQLVVSSTSCKAGFFLMTSLRERWASKLLYAALSESLGIQKWYVLTHREKADWTPAQARDHVILTQSLCRLISSIELEFLSVYDENQLISVLRGLGGNRV